MFGLVFVIKVNRGMLVARGLVGDCLCQQARKGNGRAAVELGPYPGLCFSFVSVRLESNKEVSCRFCRPTNHAIQFLPGRGPRLLAKGRRVSWLQLEHLEAFVTRTRRQSEMRELQPALKM